MTFLDSIEDPEFRAYVESLPTKQARHVEWRRTQRTPCPALTWCTGCHQFLPVTSFYLLDSDNTHGRKTILKEKRHSTCKDCQAQRYQDTRYTKKLLYAAKRRATTKQIEFNLQEEDIVIPEYCPALGLKLQPVYGLTGRDSSPSLDRINNDKGYVKGNVAVISFRANTLKNNASAQELRAIADYMDKALGNAATAGSQIDEEENERRFRECLRIIKNITREELADLMGEDFLEEFRRVSQR